VVVMLYPSSCSAITNSASSSPKHHSCLAPALMQRSECRAVTQYSLIIPIPIVGYGCLFFNASALYPPKNPGAMLITTNYSVAGNIRTKVTRLRKLMCILPPWSHSMDRFEQQYRLSHRASIASKILDRSWPPSNRFQSLSTPVNRLES
jgi:hypothetical protein